MSEKREGWLGYVDWDGIVYGEKQAGDDPVYVVPLGPDGPKPGETWDQHGFGRVVIEHPGVVNLVGGVCEWWVRDANTGRCHRTSVSSLSPIKPTRTVTVELTEKAVDELQGRCRKPSGRYSPAEIELLAALEDE